MTELVTDSGSDRGGGAGGDDHIWKAGGAASGRDGCAHQKHAAFSGISFVVASALVVTVGTDFAAGAERPAGGARDTLAHVVEAAVEIVRSTDEADGAWPGFWTGRSFALTVPGELVVLYSAGDSVTGFSRVRDVGSGRIHARRGSHPALKASRIETVDVSATVDGKTLTAVPVQDDTHGTLRLLYHEAFHAYQSKKFSPLEMPELSDGGRPSGADPDSVADLERRALAEAVAATTDSTRLDHLRTYVALRSWRCRQDRPRCRTELRVEREEGSAEYVGHRAALAVAGRDTSRIDEIVRRRLLGPLPEPDSEIRIGGMTWEERGRLYGTGAAIALVLDRLDVEGWRARLEEGASFFALVREAVDDRKGASRPRPSAGKLGPGGPCR